MSQIKVSLYDQTAVFTETPDIFSGDIDVDTVKFTFDDSWYAYNKKTAIFYNDPKKSYPVFLDDTNTAVIPSAVIDRRTKLCFGVIGTNANNEVKTSSILSYRIERGAISADVEIPPSSADIWLQILLNYEVALKKLKDMSNNLENMNNTLEELDQRFIDAGVENKANKDLSNVTDTDFSNKCKSAGIPVINKIPVDLTGIYNTQMIGYDEKQGKLVPMNAVARTETVIPDSLKPWKYKFDATSSSKFVANTNYNTIRISNSSSLGTATYKHIVKGNVTSTRAYMLSEYTKIRISDIYFERWTTRKPVIFELSKTSNFSKIEAQTTGNGELNISALKGSYYWRLTFEMGITGSTNYNTDAVYFQCGSIEIS